MRPQRRWQVLLAPIIILWTNVNLCGALPVPDDELDTSPRLLGSSVVASISLVNPERSEESRNINRHGSINMNALKNSNDLPASPADLLRPDRFQFYAYNDRGDMITRQMTVAEIQALIAGGGAGHAPMEIHEPQKADDVFTGGKKVMDVVQKVQNVLKSAMDKPATMIGSVPTIPEQANAEWSSILPGILSGDVGTLPANEQAVIAAYIPEEAGPQADRESQIESDPNGLHKGNIGAIEDAEVEEKQKIRPDLHMYPEKPMIPVPVITAEEKLTSTQHPQTGTPLFHIVNVITTDDSESKTEAQQEDQTTQTVQSVIVSQTTSSMVDHTRPITDTQYVQIASSTVLQNADRSSTKLPDTKPASVENPELHRGSSTEVEERVSSTTRPVMSDVTPKESQSTLRDQSSFDTSTASGPASFENILTGALDSIAADLMSNQPAKLPVMIDENVVATTESAQVTRLRTKATTPKVEEGTEIIRKSSQGSNVKASPTTLTLTTSGVKEPVYQMLPEIKPNKSTPPSSVGLYTQESIRTTDSKLQPPSSYRSSTTLSMSSTTPNYESLTSSETKKTSIEKVSSSPDESQKTNLTEVKDQAQLEARPLETLNVELSNSLSSVINQVSETVPSILHVPPLTDAPKVPMMHGNTKHKVTAGKGTTTTVPTQAIAQKHQESEKSEEGNIKGSTNVDTNKEQTVKISSTNSSLSVNPNLLGIEDGDASEKIEGTRYSVMSKPVDNSEGSSTLKSNVPVSITSDKSIVRTTLPSVIELSITEAKTTKSPISESAKSSTSIVGTTPMPVEMKISSYVESTTLKGVTDKTTVSLKASSAAVDKMKPNGTHDTITPEATLQKPGELVLSILSKPMHATTNFPQSSSKVSVQSSTNEIEYSKVAPMVVITSQASEVTKNESIVASTSPSPSTASADTKDSFVKVQLADPVSIINHLLESNPVQSDVSTIEIVTLPSGNDQVTSASNLASGLVAGFLPDTKKGSEIYQNKKDDESEKKKPHKTTYTLLEPTANVTRTSIADSIKDLQATTEKVFKSNSTEEKVIFGENIKIKIGSAQKNKEQTKVKETLKEKGKVEASTSLVVKEDAPLANIQAVKDSSIKASSTAIQNQTNPTIVIEPSTKENPEKLIINVTGDQKDNSKPESSIIRINISPEIIQEELPEKIQLTDLPILREEEKSSPATTLITESSSDSAVATTDSLPLYNTTTVSSVEKNSAHLSSQQTSTERNVRPMKVEVSSNKFANKKPVLVYPPMETTANLVTSEKPKDSTTLRIEIVPTTVQLHKQPFASSTPEFVTSPTSSLTNRRPEATITTTQTNTQTESETENPIIRITESVLLQSSANEKVNDATLNPGVPNVQIKGQNSAISENTKKNEDTASKPAQSTAQTPLQTETTRAPAQNMPNENAEKIAGTEQPQKNTKPQSATFDSLQIPHVQATSSAKPTKHSNSQSSANHNVKQSQHTAAHKQKVENTHSEVTDIDDEEHKWALIPHQTRPTTTKIGKPPKDSFTNVRTTTAPSTNSVRKPEDQAPVNQHPEVHLSASHSISGLDVSARNTSSDIVNFSKLCNELGFSFWMATNKGLSTGRSLALSPFGMTSLLAMLFLGARGPTSEQMNEVLRLDDVATFNPHLIFQNVTDTVGLARDQGIANAAFVRELFADKVKVRKLLPFYKEQAQQFYEGLVAEVNFATISDLVRRRTNLLIRKQTGGRIKDFVKTNTVPLRSPLAALSANVFQTDCNSSVASSVGRDGELYFAVSPAVRQRKLIPVPATVWRSNVLAGYEPSLDATAVALGGIDRLVSTIFVIPGQQGNAAPGDTLDRLEQRLVRGAFRDGSWNKLLKVLIPRHGLELQIPKFSHRSVVNATAALKRMGLDELFSGHADLKGINGVGNRLHLADVLQMNLFSTCGDENIANGRHHVETYPSSPLRSVRHREKEDDRVVEVFAPKDVLFGNNHETEQIHERRRKQAVTSTEKPRLKLDRPFLYFVRHNPTGLILHMGRFNPRLLP